MIAVGGIHQSELFQFESKNYVRAGINKQQTNQKHDDDVVVVLCLLTELNRRAVSNRHDAVSPTTSE